MARSRMIQIVPADPGWSAVYRRSDGTEALSPLVAWGLHPDGDVIPLVVDVDQAVIDPRTSDRFITLDYQEEHRDHAR